MTNSETRWFRMRGQGQYLTYESKFLTSDFTISISQLKSEWASWSDSERLEFTVAFSSKGELTAEDQRIVEFLITQTDERVLVASAMIATRHPDKNLVLKFFERQLLRRSAEPKSNFIQGLEILGGPTAVEALKRLYAEMQLKAQDGVTGMDSWEALDFLDCCGALMRLERDSKYLTGLECFAEFPDDTVRFTTRQLLTRR